MRKIGKIGRQIIIAVLLVLSFSLVTAAPVPAKAGAPLQCLSGYQVITSNPAYVDGGWGDCFVPAGKVVLGGGFVATAPVSTCAPGTPNSVWPHRTYGADEYGWVVRDAPDGVPNRITIYAICADPPPGYEVLTSNVQNYGDGGWAGWSVTTGQVVLGGGFNFNPYDDAGSGPAGPAAASAPGTPNSVWPHWTYGANEYGWVVRDALDGKNNWGSYIYAILADEPAGYEVAISSALYYSDTGWGGWSVPECKVVTGGGFNLGPAGTAGPAAASAPGTPNSDWPHYPYGPNEYGWVAQAAANEASDPGSYVYAIGTTYAGTITVVKDTDPPGSPQDFEITGTVPGLPALISSDSPPWESGCIQPGSYYVEETVPPCWELTGVQVTGASDYTVTDAKVDINLQPCEDVTVTFQDMQWGWIIVEKQTDPEGTNMTFDFAGDRSGTIGDDEQLTGLCLPPYTQYWSQEMDTYLWELMDILIEGDNYPVIDGGTESHYDLTERKVYFNLDPGEVIKATFTNKYFPPPEEPPAEDHGAAVGIEVHTVDKIGLIAPWIVLAVVIIAGGVVLLIRRRAHS